MKAKSNNDTAPKKRVYGWVIKIVLLTFVLSIMMSFIAESFLHTVSLPIAFIILIVFILIGVTFDTIGISIAAAELTPFISMSSKKIHGASQAIYLLKRADIVTNICNDVVGDICGIISGSMGAIITLTILQSTVQLSQLLIAVIISAMIATLTVSGKAVGKIIAMRKSKEITLFVGRVLRLLHLKFKREK
ncbi:MAG: hypothetical protein KAQ68_03260 [Clostridiales bacterium]|nr:hypothetical protein [Clostridiales bacterium]